MTPALLVPDTPEGKLYKSLPSILGKIANRVQEQSANLNLISALNGWMTEGAAEHLHGLLLAQLDDFDFGSAQQIGAAGMVQWLQHMPLFTWDAQAPQIETMIWIDVARQAKSFKLPMQQRKPGLYAVHPNFAYGYLGMMPNKLGQRGYMDLGGGVCYAVYDPQAGVLFSQGFVNTTALAISEMVRQLQFGADFQALGRSAWVTLPEFYTEVEDSIRFEFGVDTRPNFPTRQISPEYSEATLYPWPASFANHPVLLIQPFAELGSKLDQARGRKERGELLQLVAMAAAVVGGVGAIESITTQGASFGNVAKLIGSIDNLPGVDLGDVGKVAKGLSSGVNLAFNIPGGVHMFDFEVNVGDVVELTLDDIGSTLSPSFDTSIFANYGLEATDLLGDEFGNVFTVAGDAVTLDPESYIKTIYIDEAGNYRDFSNDTLLSAQAADQVFNESGFDDNAVNRAVFENAVARGGQSFVADQSGNPNRPAGAPPPASQVQVPFLQTVSEQALKWFTSITSYSLAKEQLQKTGRYTPPYATNPTGTPRSQVPGVPVQRADGSVLVNNGNGTQTIRYPDGRTQTTPTSYNPATAGSGQLIGGVSNQTLLLAGTGLLAALLLIRR